MECLYRFEYVPLTQKVNSSSKKLVDSGFYFKCVIDQIIEEGVE